MTIRIELAGPPKGKGRPRFVRATGHAYTPTATREYEAALRAEAMVAMRGVHPFEKAVCVDVRAYLPIPTSWPKSKQADAAMLLVKPTGRPDCDNLLKVALDSLNQIVWHDDGQVMKATVSKKYSNIPKLVVEVAEL